MTHINGRPRGYNYSVPNWTKNKLVCRATCGHTIYVGDLITWIPATREKYCNRCSHQRAAAQRAAERDTNQGKENEHE